MTGAAPWLQRSWDWRAAGNFIGGGAGAGLLAATALATASGRSPLLPTAVGLVLIAAGLGCVWLEIGRPWRALNVFRHARTSWMTRESLLAPPLFAAGALAAGFGSVAASWLAAALGLGFLYCQARILAAAKGIPAWREPAIVPLIVATGLAEGAGLLILVLAATSRVAPWLAVLLIALVAARALAWHRYRASLSRRGAPAAALKWLEALDRPLLISGTLLAAALSTAAFMPWPLAPWLAGLGAIAAIGCGWTVKFTIVVRAAFNQGYALRRLPVRGAGPGGPAAKPGWATPRPAAVRPEAGAP